MIALVCSRLVPDESNGGGRRAVWLLYTGGVDRGNRQRTTMRYAVIAWLLLACLVWTWPAAAAPSGDANCDGILDHDDVPALTQSFFGDVTCSDADTNTDGLVSAADLPSLITSFAAGAAMGPTTTFFGVASSAGDVTTPLTTTSDGLPVYWRPVGIGFSLVIEAAIGTSGKAIGRVTEPTSGRPDVQIESSRTLGDGGFDQCPGTVPAIDPEFFGPGDLVDGALRAFACGLRISTTRATACTLDGFGNHNWVEPATQAQFCLKIESLRRFPDGLTRLTVRLRDTDGNLGPAGRIAVQVGAVPTETVRPTRTPTSVPIATATPTRTTTAGSSTATRSSTHTRTPTATQESSSPTATATSMAGSPSPSLSPTATPSLSPTTGTSPTTSVPSRTATRSHTPTSTSDSTRTATGATPTRTATRTRTRTQTGTRTPTPTMGIPPTFTRTPSPTPKLTSTSTQTRTPTPTPSPTLPPQPEDGPLITFLGVVNANDSVATSIGETPEGIPIYERLLGSSLRLVVEGRPGRSGRPVGISVFEYDPEDPMVRPDLQIQVNRPLGDGSAEVCDNSLPMIGGIPGIDPPSFAFTDEISAALSDLGCRFVDGQGVPGPRGSSEACTSFPDGNFRFVCSSSSSLPCENGQSTIQFCSDFVLSAFAFPSGDTLVTVQLRDRALNVGFPAQLLIRVR